MASTKGKSSRVGAILNILNKEWKDLVENGKQEEFGQYEQIKIQIDKLQHLLKSCSEKCAKDMLSKHDGSITLLFEIMQISCKIDYQVTASILEVLLALICSGKGLNPLMEAGLLRHICECFACSFQHFNTWKDISLVGDVWIPYHTIFNKMASKEKRFGTVIRLSGVLQSSLQLTRTFSSNHRILLPIFQLLKNCSSSLVNTCLMVKHGLLEVVMKVIPLCGQKRTIILKVCLDLLNAMCKSKSGARKAVVLSTIPVMLSMYQELHRSDHRNRQTAIRKSILTVIKWCTVYRLGRKSFHAVEGFRMLYSLGLEGIENKELEGVVRVIITILRKCTLNNKLPLKSDTSCITFPLPKPSLCSTSSCETTIELQHSEPLKVEIVDQSEESSDEQSDEEVLSCDSNTEENYEEEILSADLPSQTNVDFNDYKEFFKELYELPGCSSIDSLTTIKIPTAELEDEKYTTKEFYEQLDENPVVDTSSSTTNTSNINGLSSALKNFYLGESDDQINIDADEENVSSYSSCVSNISNQNSLSSINGCSQLKYSNIQKTMVRHALPFVIRALPEVYGHLPVAEPEPLLIKKPYIHRLMIFQDFARTLYDEKIINRVVFDLDAFVSGHEVLPKTDELPRKKSPIKKSRSVSKFSPLKRGSSTNLASFSSKDDVHRTSPLSFESRFECGNLRKAIQIRDNEYDLMLNTDVNTYRHHQWFYFQVENMESGVEYRFNIINCEKPNSQFNFGMQPLFYSHKEAINGNPGWERLGTNVCYYRNNFLKGTSTYHYYTVAFNITFPYADDTCYLAYHYPYTFTMLNTHLQHLEKSLTPDIYYRKQTLCQTLSKNDISLLTITGVPYSRSVDVCSRPYIVFTARVHPGESNSSWIMQGVIDYLLSNAETAKQLRSMFIFKIIPMLNPDGVINGCHRCSMSGQDLNRQWKNPDHILHPSIYHVKSLLQCMKRIKKTPRVLIDFHGHSRKKNVFMYGCCPVTPVVSETHQNDASEEMDNDLFGGINTVKLLPRILNAVAPCFSLQNCAFVMEKSKEATARIVGYKELDIIRCYTMESTYCGMDQGPNKGNQISTRELEDMGKHLCAALLKLHHSSLMTSHDNDVVLPM